MSCCLKCRYPIVTIFCSEVHIFDQNYIEHRIQPQSIQTTKLRQNLPQIPAKGSHCQSALWYLVVEPSKTGRGQLQLLVIMKFYNLQIAMERTGNKSIPEIYLFVNSTSGGGIGKQLLNQESKQLHLEVAASQHPADRNNKITVTLRLFDMTQPESRNEGFSQLKKTQENSQRVILVISGGDGTVMWVVSQLGKFEIDHSKVPIAMLPLGTGNDFSRVLGWGKECPSDLLDGDMKKLKKRITYWLSAREESLDIWMVEASVQDYGKFEKVSKQQSTVIEAKTITKHFCNYFSVGVDGKIGYSFDLHRTSSRFGNLVVYGAMGVVKSFTKTKTVGQLAHDLKEIVPKEVKEEQINLKLNTQNKVSNQLPNNSEQKMILAPGSPELNEIKDNQNLLFLNIDSFMAGVKDIWKNAKTPESLKERQFGEQSSGDGKIEVLSFGGAWSLGFEKSIGGFATKIHQGTGPFELNFNTFPPQEKHRTYLQIDGQFIRYTHPKSLTVRKSTLSKTGKMRVLRRVPLQIQRRCCC